jgi:hypothetical protein
MPANFHGNVILITTKSKYEIHVTCCRGVDVWAYTVFFQPGGEVILKCKFEMLYIAIFKYN